MYEKTKKIGVVVFLTILIWAWAYLALEQPTSQPGTLNVSAIRQDVLVTFVDREAPVNLELELKGPAAKVDELLQRLHASDNDKEKERLDFYFTAEKKNNQWPTSINVLELVKTSEKIKNLNLTVISCEPQLVKIKVEEMSSQWLTIQCLDEDGRIITHKTIDPPNVEMFVPRGFKDTAKVSLTGEQIEEARKSSTTVKPYIKLRGKRKFSNVSVKVELSSTEEPLSDSPIQPMIGFLFSKKLQGKFTVKLLNEKDLITMTISATQDALEAYKKTPNQILIEVRDRDEYDTGEILRLVTYNFPQEYVRKNEIKLLSDPQQARFKLVPVTPKMSE